MATGFSSQILDEIRSRVDMVELVGQSVNLKRAGENWKGLCPFHTEKTPSFTVNPQRQLWHCFACEKAGDVYNFLKQKEGMDFPQAPWCAIAADSGGSAPAPSDRRSG